MSAVPPIGLAPKWVRDRQRILEILEAMTRFADAGKEIPTEWLVELDALNSEVRRRNAEKVAQEAEASGTGTAAASQG